MRERMGQGCLTATEEKSIESRIGTNKIILCSDYSAPSLFRNLQKRSLAVFFCPLCNGLKPTDFTSLASSRVTTNMH